MVPPGTAARAAALALSAAVPVSSFSTTPLVPTWPPLLGSEVALPGWFAGGDGLGVVPALPTAPPAIRPPPSNPTIATTNPDPRPNRPLGAGGETLAISDSIGSSPWWGFLRPMPTTIAPTAQNPLG